MSDVQCSFRRTDAAHKYAHEYVKIHIFSFENIHYTRKRMSEWIVYIFHIRIYWFFVVFFFHRVCSFAELYRKETKNGVSLSIMMLKSILHWFWIVVNSYIYADPDIQYHLKFLTSALKFTVWKTIKNEWYIICIDILLPFFHENYSVFSKRFPFENIWYFALISYHHLLLWLFLCESRRYGNDWICCFTSVEPYYISDSFFPLWIDGSLKRLTFHIWLKISIKYAFSVFQIFWCIVRRLSSCLLQIFNEFIWVCQMNSTNFRFRWFVFHLIQYWQSILWRDWNLMTKSDKYFLRILDRFERNPN